MKRIVIAVLAASALLLGAAPAAAVELHGYWRSGLGGNSVGGGQTCLGLSQFGYKFRLGNECETYGELEFRQNLFKDRSGVEVNFVGMLAVQNTQKSTFESVKIDNAFPDISMRQSWIGAKLPQLGGATVWAGNRYYRRNDVHIIDFYYWDTSGPGAGVEDIPLPAKMHLALAVFQSPNDRLAGGENQENSPPPYHGAQARWQIWRPDVRVYDIPFFVGNLEAGVSLFVNANNTHFVSAGEAQRFSPWLTVQHFWPGLFGGFNKVAFQWATGSAAPMNAFPQYGNTKDSKHWRVVEQLVVNPIEKFSGMFVFAYEDIRRRYGGASGDFNTARLWTIGGRPQFHITDYFRIATEIGYQQVTVPGYGTDGAGTSRRLWKYTLAPTYSFGSGFFARPELRIYASYFDWNVGAQERNVAGFNSWGTCNPATTTSPWSCDTNGVTFGAQMEAWW